MNPAYERAMSSIRKGLSFNQGGPGAESDAAIGYQEEVKAGREQQIRKKYREGKQLKKARS